MSEQERTVELAVEAYGTVTNPPEPPEPPNDGDTDQ